MTDVFTCRILALEKLGAVFNQVSMPLNLTPRKFVIHPESNNLVVIETDHNAYTEETKSQRKQQMAEVICSRLCPTTGLRHYIPFGSQTGRAPTRTGKPGKMGRHFSVGEKSGNFEQFGKVRENHTKFWEFQTNFICYLNELCEQCIIC